MVILGVIMIECHLLYKIKKGKLLPIRFKMRFITMNIPEISVHELKALREAGVNFFLLDVRNPEEYQHCNLGGYLIPFSELISRIDELSPEQHIIIHCHAGGRSRRATEFLINQGFKKVSNLRGGITAWANEIDPSLPRY